jgi:hypothetical protein
MEAAPAIMAQPMVGRVQEDPRAEAVRAQPRRERRRSDAGDFWLVDNFVGNPLNKALTFGANCGTALDFPFLHSIELDKTMTYGCPVSALRVSASSASQWLRCGRLWVSGRRKMDMGCSHD